MAKIPLREQKIESIKEDEEILLEGLLQTMRLIGKKLFVTYKFALTNRGVWTRSKRFLWRKPQEVFISYNDILGYNLRKYGQRNYFVFFPKTGRVGNGIFFEQHEKALEVISQFLKVSTPK